MLVNVYSLRTVKSPSSMGKSTINGPCSIAMLNYQRADDICWWNEMFLLCTKVFLVLKNRLKCGLSSPIWRFPNWLRATPSSHPLDGMFHETSFGYPHDPGFSPVGSMIYHRCSAKPQLVPTGTKISELAGFCMIELECSNKLYWFWTSQASHSVSFLLIFNTLNELSIEKRPHSCDGLATNNQTNRFRTMIIKFPSC